jgi:glycosyltransferase involved in cell wall biosynthesis
MADQPQVEDPEGVLHISTERGWWGGERQVWLLARELQQRGIDQVAAVPAGSVLATRMAALGIPVLHVGATRLTMPLDLLRLVVAWRRRVPGAVAHSHTSPGLGLAAVARRLVPAGRLVHTRRVAFPVRRSYKYRYAADRYVAISEAVARGLLGAGLDPVRLSIIASAVDTRPLDLAQPTPELAPGPTRATVGCAGRMTREKGHATLLDAWSEVGQAMPEARLVLIGSGPEEPGLRRMAARCPGQPVIFAGFQDEVAPWLKALDLYVQPSLSEGLGTSVLDAMACRLPVVASNTGGLSEVVVTGTTGILVPPEDPSQLAAAILQLLSEPDRAVAMGQAGRQRVEEHFSIGKMVSAYLEVYAGVAPGRTVAGATRRPHTWR